MQREEKTIFFRLFWILPEAKKKISTRLTKQNPMLSLSMYNEMKNEIFVFFSLLLDLANQDLRGKEEDLDETDKRESHAESEHPSDVGDERNWRHHL